MMAKVYRLFSSRFLFYATKLERQKVNEDFLDKLVLMSMGGGRSWLMPARDALAILEIFSRQEHMVKVTEYHAGKSTEVVKPASTEGYDAPRIHSISEAEILRLQSEWERICTEKGNK